jgi:hypothetical protein
MVLNSARAIDVSVYVVRAFVQQRDMLVANRNSPIVSTARIRIKHKLNTHDQAISGILDVIRQLMAPPEPAKKLRIGFVQTD